MILLCRHENRFFVFVRIYKKKSEKMFLRYNYKGSEINFILYGICLKMKIHFRFFLLHGIFRRTLQMKDFIDFTYFIVWNPSTSDRHILL